MCVDVLKPWIRVHQVYIVTFVLDYSLLMTLAKVVQITPSGNLSYTNTSDCLSEYAVVLKSVITVLNHFHLRLSQWFYFCNYKFQTFWHFRHAVFVLACSICWIHSSFTVTRLAVLNIFTGVYFQTFTKVYCKQNKWYSVSQDFHPREQILYSAIWMMIREINKLLW